MDAITSFRGPFRFLSNPYPTVVVFDRLQYASVEYAFQAAKTFGVARMWIRSAPTWQIAKSRGNSVKLRPDWENVKIDIMRGLLLQKFTHPNLREKLLATGDAQLYGQNILGKLLMETREAIAKCVG